MLRFFDWKNSLNIGKTASFVIITLMGGHAILGSHAVPGFSSGEKRCVTTQMLDAKLHLDPAFYHSVFLQFLFLTIANELYCITSSDWLSLDHAVKNLALTQRGLA